MKLDEKTLQDLKNRKIQVDDLNDEYFVVEEIYYDEDHDKRSRISFEAENILTLLNNEICSFKNLINKLKNIQDKDTDSCLYVLLSNEKVFTELIKNNKLTRKDLKILLNRLDNRYEVDTLCDISIFGDNTLIKHILNEFVLNKELVEKFNKLLKKYSAVAGYKDLDADGRYKDLDIHNIFELIDWHATHYKAASDYPYVEIVEERIDKELLKLTKLNRTVCSFDEEQSSELASVLRSNEAARNKLFQILENKLESNYDFNSLMHYLKKREKKNLINV